MTILRKDVIAAIQNGEPITMEYVTADRRRGTGGDLISVDNWLKVSTDVPKEPTLRQAQGDNPLLSGHDRHTDPDHAINGTVNIYNPANPGIHPHKVHWDLIQFFNGKRVIN